MRRKILSLLIASYASLLSGSLIALIFLNCGDNDYYSVLRNSNFLPIFNQCSFSNFQIKIAFINSFGIYWLILIFISFSIPNFIEILIYKAKKSRKIIIDLIKGSPFLFLIIFMHFLKPIKVIVFNFLKESIIVNNLLFIIPFLFIILIILNYADKINKKINNQ